ncbi:MAG: cysteinyl-tRNA synthetase [Trizodia sp. TS-e1964]|nr:MAG: cysteinyl-tRNA synthetase [Trizodia sp. TS-e1964]
MTRGSHGGVRNSSTESSSGDSWASHDTIRASYFGGGSRGSVAMLSTDGHNSYDQDTPVSPGSGAPMPSPSPSSPNVSPRDYIPAGFGNHRRDLGVLQAYGGPSTSSTVPRKLPPAAPPPAADVAPWLSADPPSNTISGSFYDDSTDPPHPSPSFRPATGRTGASDSPEPLLFGDERRPSVASAATGSSTSSSVGRGFHKKLQGFFGEDPSSQTPYGSETSLPIYGREHSSFSHRRERKGSAATAHSFAGRPASPANSRPRTPIPSSEVTPWAYQEFQDIPQFGNAPVRLEPAGPDKQRYVDIPPKSSSSIHPHKLHFPVHRHTRSKEDSARLTREYNGASPKDLPLRPNASREASSNSMSRLKDQSTLAAGSSLRLARPSSPTNIHSNMNRDGAAGQRSPVAVTKRSFFDKFKKAGRNKDEYDGLLTLKALPGSVRSLHEPFGKLSKASRIDFSPGNLGRNRDGSVSGTEGATTMRNHDTGTLETTPNRKDHSKLPSSHAKTRGAKAKDPGNGRNGSLTEPTLFELDLDLSHMEGIVSHPPVTPPVGVIFTGTAATEASQKEPDEYSLNGALSGAWNAPDSWAVKKVADVNAARLKETRDAKIPEPVPHDGPPYFIRVFRVDSTFATLSTNLNASASDLLAMLAKKSFLQDSLSNYQIVMRKNEMQRILDPNERPIAIQKRLLMQAGYTDKDRPEELGREDNSYLCRFTFVPVKLSGYYSLESDPGLGRLSKFSQVDLQGRNLITIPITLYQKATEIISLNLSRNLSLNVPKDFIQGCVNLREIKYLSNEAWRLPPSLALAQRLTYLDISNNRLEQLNHIDLSKLQSLVSIKMSNNSLTLLPKYFGQFKMLRNLNISSNYLDQFPEFISSLVSLVDLDLSFNAIQEMPEDIGNLVALERLLITNNRLTGSLPESFGCLVNMKEIDIRFNAISNINVLTRLPKLEQLMMGHNSVSVFEGSFPKIRTLYLNHNPVTRFTITDPIPSLTTLNLASAKLAQLDDDPFERMPNLEKLILDKNHFVTLTDNIGKLRKLEHLSVAKNALNSLPAEIGCLHELRFLDVRENNLKKLPGEIWCMTKLESLNVSSNVLEAFPKPGASPPAVPGESPVSVTNGLHSSHHTPLLSSSSSFEELGKLETFGVRRPSQASGGLLSLGTSPATSQRNGSMASIYGPPGRKVSKVTTDGIGTPAPSFRKDSYFSTKVANTFAASLRYLYLADNRLNDDVFDEICFLPELKVVNLSYNELYEVPPRSIRRWPNLAELYLSGNELTSLPSDDLEEVKLLKVLHINGNKFQVLPAELGKVHKLAVLDVGSNFLKYNVSNWPYDWNWNWNVNLKYLNLSGNKKLEIKPSQSSYSGGGGRDGRDLTDFSSLHNLRVLGLMDVTLTAPSVPDQTEDKRVRTSGSLAGGLMYGMADTLGRCEHLSTIDMVVPRFRGLDSETLIGMFDGQALSSGGSKVSKFLHENFQFVFTEELKKLNSSDGPADALRRTFLTLNKELATAASIHVDHRSSHLSHRGSSAAAVLSQDDLHSGGVATVLYIQDMELFVANVGDAQAMLIQSEGNFKIITQQHDPAKPSERQRIREAGGFVSRHGKLNDVLEVSRAFGYIQLMPSVMAAPHIAQITIREQDEMVLIASKELWDYLSSDMVLDIARSERGDLMLAAQKLRDLAIAYGAQSKIMVMMIGVSDLRKRERNRFRAQSLSMGPSGLQDDLFVPAKRVKRLRDGPDDSSLRRLDDEVQAPTGELAMVFTDIKNSTWLWENFPIAMRSSIQLHNKSLRRQLRIIGGYEVKTEGDAFMVSFPSSTAALCWCFSVQSALLSLEWPSEILSSEHGLETIDANNNIVYRGLSVRMGIHWGSPVCEPDPITKRMDYFGPMVNRASRISSVADGGEITVSEDFLSELQKTLQEYSEIDRITSICEGDPLDGMPVPKGIRKDLHNLTGQGFEVQDLGAHRLKGLENAEHIYLMYPHSLSGRLAFREQRLKANSASAIIEPPKPFSLSKTSKLNINIETVESLLKLSLRLERICSMLEDPASYKLKAPETAMMDIMKVDGGEITDAFLLNFLDHQISRIETCVTTLCVRQLVRPFKPGTQLLAKATPMSEVLMELSSQLKEFALLKGQLVPTTPARF